MNGKEIIKAAKKYGLPILGVGSALTLGQLPVFNHPTQDASANVQNPEIRISGLMPSQEAVKSSERVTNYSVEDLNIGPDGKAIAVVNAEGRGFRNVVTIDLSSGESHDLGLLPFKPLVAKISPTDSQVMAVGGYGDQRGNEGVLWITSDGWASKTTLKLNGAVMDMQFTPDNQNVVVQKMALGTDSHYSFSRVSTTDEDEIVEFTPYQNASGGMQTQLIENSAGGLETYGPVYAYQYPTDRGYAKTIFKHDRTMAVEIINSEEGVLNNKLTQFIDSSGNNIVLFPSWYPPPFSLYGAVIYNINDTPTYMAYPKPENYHTDGYVHPYTAAVDVPGGKGYVGFVLKKYNGWGGQTQSFNIEEFSLDHPEDMSLRKTVYKKNEEGAGMITQLDVLNINGRKYLEAGTNKGIIRYDITNGFEQGIQGEKVTISLDQLNKLYLPLITSIR